MHACSTNCDGRVFVRRLKWDCRWFIAERNWTSVIGWTLLVEDLVVVEIKSVEGISPVHQAQVISYLKLSGKSIGLLINFNVVHLKDGIKRLVNGTGWREFESFNHEGH